MSRDVDVVVVGGRVAGASTAMLLARQGHRVLALDRAALPSDTVSTHALLRSGVCNCAGGVSSTVWSTRGPRRCGP